MSPSNINSFVGDLVQMAKAMETLPQVEAENERLNGMVENYAKQVQALELRAIDRNAEISTLHDRIRSLEVERDDASFRVLEAEDRAHVALIAARSATASLGDLIAELDPPKPEPVKEPEPQQSWPTPAEGSQSVADPSQDVSTGSVTAENITGTTVPEAVHSISELPGQSESSPTSSNISQEVTKSVEAVSSNATLEAGSANQSADPGPALGPYFGKRYRDVPYYVSNKDWIAGGGTDEDYYNTPSPY
jgi:hypothetical protein